VVDGALEQLPRDVVEHARIVVRTDSAGATHEFLDYLHEGQIGYLCGYDLTESVRRAILDLPEHTWVPALRQDGCERDGAQVAELTDQLDLAAWPEGSRVIVRRERPHPGAQLSFHRPRRTPLPRDPHRPVRRARRARTPPPRSRKR
jgi:hypothetical protein